VFSRAGGAKTQKLTGPSYALTISRKRPLVFVLAWSLVMLGCGLGVGMWWQQSRGSQGSDLREQRLQLENTQFSQALHQAELQATHEASLRESLERQLAEQSEEVKRLRGELAFFQKNRKLSPGGQ